MKIKEVELKEGLGDIIDTVRGGIYRTTGFGGKGALTAATRTRFINDFITQYKLADRSAKQGGIPLDKDQFIQSYLLKNKWVANPEQMAALEKISDPNQLANAMYAVGMQQYRDKSGYIQNTQGGVSNTSGKNDNQPEQEQDVEDTKLDPQGAQILKTLKPLKGAKYEYDLKQIIRTALWNLYGTDKQDYNDLVKQIMGQKSQPKNPLAHPADENPNIQTGTNESKVRPHKKSIK